MNFNNVLFETSFGKFSQMGPSKAPEIVFAGRSNVGKSSMINKLFARKNLARVSATPGKTATINFFTLENLCFVDLPGYGYAKVAKSEKSRWSELIAGYFADERRDIALVFSLIDMRHPPMAADIKMITFLIENELPFICVLTKADKLGKMARRARLEAIRGELPQGEDITFVEFSSETGEGVQQLREVLNEISEDIELQENTVEVGPDEGKGEKPDETQTEIE